MRLPRRTRRPGRAHARAPRGDDRAQALAPRGGDPVSSPGRLLANGMGVWKVPEDRSRRSARVWPLCAASRTVTGARPIPTGPTASSMPHGRSKEECDAVLDGVAGVCGLEGGDRATLSRPPSSRRSASTTSRPTMPTGRRGIAEAARPPRRLARAVRARARADPGRRKQPCARDGPVGRDPLFVAGAGAELVDVDGNRYVDYVCSWGR